MRAQVIAKNARQGMQEFFGIKTRKEDWSYAPIGDLPLSGVRKANRFAVTVGAMKFARYDYEPVRGARARV